MRKYILYLLCIFPLVSGFQVNPGADTNARIKSVFIYNFTRYIEWPAEYKKGNFVITVFGSNTGILTELQNMAKVKKVGEQAIEVRNTTSLDGLAKSHILYIAPDVTISLGDVVSKLKGKSTLLVTEKSGYAKQGAAINFVVMENKQKFELNKTNAEKYSLKVSAALENLAIPVQ